MRWNLLLLIVVSFVMACSGSSGEIAKDVVDTGTAEDISSVDGIPDASVDVPTVDAEPVCGDGDCSDKVGEDCDTCPEDCGLCPPECGDGDCTAPEEDCDTCPEDCQPCGEECGNDSCAGAEDCMACPEDCGECCGDGECLADHNEDCWTCPVDCGDCCGDGECVKEHGEDCLGCPEDCGECCGDGECLAEDGEDCSVCEEDCGACCGDGECVDEHGESCFDCETDCGACCGDGECTEAFEEDCGSCAEDCGVCPDCLIDGECAADTETCANCPDDCGACCGDDECVADHGEDCATCEEDCGPCGPACDNGDCEEGEDCLNCAADCGACCGDGDCNLDDHDEDCATCAADCGECPPGCGDGILQTDLGEQCDDGNLEGGDGCDEGCDVEPVAALAGAIIITEIMPNPDAAGDAVGEWFEIYNTTDEDVDLNAWSLGDADSDSHKLFKFGGIIVLAGDYLVLGKNDDPVFNGGVDVDYVYQSFNLSNSDDEVILKSGDTTVDEVYYDAVSFPNAGGVSLNLSLSAYDHLLNDLGVNWCEGTIDFGDGDLGSPGFANQECPEPGICGDDSCDPLLDEDCQSCPADCGGCCGDGQCSAEHGEDCGLCPADCGECCGDEQCDVNQGESCQSCPQDCGVCCGNGACDADVGETCQSCAFDCGICCGNGECQDAFGETCATCAPDCGVCPSECGNNEVEPGETCDDGNQIEGDGCSALCLTEFAEDIAPGMLIITEVMKNPKLAPDATGEWVEIMNVSNKSLDINGWVLKDDGNDLHTIANGGPLTIPSGGIMVLGASADEQANGGVAVDYVFDGFTLGNGADEVILVAPGDIVIDSLFYNDDDYPDTSGSAMSLDPAAYDAAENDSGGNWCNAIFPLPGGDFGSPKGINPSCSAIPVCGNGVKEAAEDCDDGNTMACDGCSSVCELEIPPICGNGQLENCEECDDGNLIDGDGCSVLCEIVEPSVCGNGIVEPGEGCDDGNLIPLDGCNEDCVAEGVCGNGVVEPGENCDDGNLEDGDGCGAMCDIEYKDPVCGDGIVEGPGTDWPDGEGLTPGSEWCDDGNNINGDGCTAECQFEDIVPWHCGNSITEPANNENCDDGNNENGDGCNEWCKNECNGVCDPCGLCCGDGFTTEGEQCDDGNITDGDGCSSLCTYEIDLTSISGNILFAGDPAPGDKVYIVAFPVPYDDPVNPGGDPSTAAIMDAKFPLDYQLNVAAGTHYVAVVYDVGGNAAAGFGEEDFGVWYLVDGEPGPVVVVDGEQVLGINMDLSPDGAPGSISGTINFDTQPTEADVIRVTLASEVAPDIVAVKTQEFGFIELPYDFMLNNISPGQYYIAVSYDVGNDNGGIELSPGDGFNIYSDADGEAILIPVTEGAQITGIDLTLDPVE